MAKKKAINLDQFFSSSTPDDDLTFLIGAPPEEAATRAAERGLMLQQLPTAVVAPDPQQLRHLPHPSELRRLADNGDRAAEALVGGLEQLGRSIAEHGQIQPVVVYPDHDPDDPQITHRLLNGHRRWSAAVLMGLPTVWAVEVAAPSETTRLLRQFEENERREGFSDMERAWALIALKDALQRDAGGEVPWSVIEEQLQLSPQRRQDLLRLLRFTPESQAIIMRYGWSEWTLRSVHMAINAGTLAGDDATDMLRALAEAPEVNATVVSALVDGYRMHATGPSHVQRHDEEAAMPISRAEQVHSDIAQRLNRLRRASELLRKRLSSVEDPALRRSWEREAAQLRRSLEILIEEL